MEKDQTSLMAKAANGRGIENDAVNTVTEEERSRLLADRYRCEFINLRDYKIDHELFHSIPVDLMFRYNFVPLRAREDSLEIAMADPSQLMMIDEVALLLDKRLVVRVATLTQISEYLKKTEQSQRVLEEATEGFALDLIHDEESAENTISIDRLSAEGEISPVIRLVDTTIFTALERRAQGYQQQHTQRPAGHT